MSADEERELLERYRPWVRSLAARLVPAYLVEEYAQEAWIALWRAYKKDNGSSPQDYWLKASAHNRIISLRHSHTTYHKHTQHDFVSDMPDVHANADDVAVESAILMSYHHGQIHRALDALSPREREYVVLRFWHGYQLPEFRKHFGYNPNSLWRTARAKLQAALADLRDCG